MNVTIVGKIELPKKNQERTYQFDRAFIHFRKRLKERYHIDINMKEYKALCKMPLLNPQKGDNRFKRGFLQIKEVSVLVIKRPDSILITALPTLTQQPLKQ